MGLHVGGREQWEPLGDAGAAEVRELLALEALSRYFAADRDAELDLARTTVAGRPLEVGARWQLRSAVCAGVSVELDLSGEPDPAGGYRKTLRAPGSQGSVVLQTDETRRTRLRGALRFLRVQLDDRSWVWHFDGGRAAGERLTLCRGDLPGDGAPVVTTYPAARGRSLGNPKGGATLDTHVTSWSADASLGELVLAELLATCRLDRLVDYRPSRIAEGVGELIELLPRPEANTS